MPISSNLTASVVLGPVIYTVPVNTTWQIICGHVFLTTSATGGNRWVRMVCMDDLGEIVWDTHAGVRQGSSQIKSYNFRMGGVRERQFADDDIVLSIPHKNVLLTNWTLTICDGDEVDLANDSFDIAGEILVTAGSDVPVRALL